ncbi:MAG: hypothetical protein HOE90_01715 [Bacteriovoracaceae bacterium]|jgi:hypothetical protein|nr:hypothetical protein [Bacteriovoracaceae bacterium]
MNVNPKQQEQEVLFQKLGKTWYVFSEIDGDFIYSALPEEIDPRTTKLELFHLIEDHVKKVANLQKRRPIEPTA